MPESRLTVELLAVPAASAAVLYGIYDIFASAGRDWRLLVEGRAEQRLFDVRVVARSDAPMRVANDVWLQPDAPFGEPPDIVCVPEISFLPDEPLSGRFDTETAWLWRCHAAHSTLATACSGALLLAEAGLLENRDATTHWLYCDTLARYPGIRVHRDRALVQTDGGGLVMAGGGTTWQDLALYLVARFAGVDEAMRIARLYLIDWHEVGQQPFAMLTCTRQSADADVARCQTWIARHYETAAPVQAMIQRSGLSERSFNRRFKQATGMAPMQYVHTLRLEESKHLLETTAEPVEAIAEAVGYEDASFFGRLFRRNVGLTPAQYRRRFGGLRRVLESQTTPAGPQAPSGISGSTNCASIDSDSCQPR
jgi:transcriptional regulator GlxA family with amidase domain